MTASQGSVAMSNQEHKQLSLLENVSKKLVCRFFGSFISTGCLNLFEAGGSNLSFQGTSDQCSLTVDLHIHNPQFYWKVMTRADLGVADAFIDGDFSCADEEGGLLKLFMLLIANRDAYKSGSALNKKRGWSTALLTGTAGLPSIISLCKHLLRQNNLTQARRNISHHYDLNNEHFASFLGETMMYSCGIFKTESEDLNTGQMRKNSVLIEKARIDKKNEVLDIGCGWGMFAIEVVKRTGCKYTGITLSEEQLKFAQIKVQEAGLQDQITFKLCDYRQLPKTDKYDRIISCEMIEHVGHEYMEEFFNCCESLLAPNGLFVLQFIAIADERYEDYLNRPGFIKEYIFPGGSLPCLSTITSAMSSSSRFCVEHVENIGSHYFKTLRMWRKNFLANKSKIINLKLDEKFIRTWEYYFDYCAAGFKTDMLRDYQIVFSRPGNTKALGDPYIGFPSAYTDKINLKVD